MPKIFGGPTTNSINGKRVRCDRSIWQIVSNDFDAIKIDHCSIVSLYSQCEFVEVSRIYIECLSEVRRDLSVVFDALVLTIAES